MPKSLASTLLLSATLLLLGACATPSPLHCAPSAPPAVIPPLPKSARQPMASHEFSERASKNIERWNEMLRKALPQEASVNDSTTP